MDGDDLSDDVFIDKHVINTDELRISDGQIPTIPISSCAKVGGCVGKDEEEVRIYAPLDYDEAFSESRHENYFYPDNEIVCEGWRSYKLSDDEPFGPIVNGPGQPIKNNDKNTSSSAYYRPADSVKPVTKPVFNDSVTHKVIGHTMYTYCRKSLNVFLFTQRSLCWAIRESGRHRFLSTSQLESLRLGPSRPPSELP